MEKLKSKTELTQNIFADFQKLFDGLKVEVIPTSNHIEQLAILARGLNMAGGVALKEKNDDELIFENNTAN